MNKTTLFLLKKYKEMSGDKKVRIAFGLSKMVKRIRKDGIIANRFRTTYLTN